MTTTIDPADPASYGVSYTDVTADWLEHLVPQTIRENGAELLRELQQIRLQIIPLLPRLQAFADWSEHANRRACRAVREVAGAEAEHEVADGILGLVGTLSHASDVFALLTDLGLDPDDLETAAKELGEVEV